MKKKKEDIPTLEEIIQDYLKKNPDASEEDLEQLRKVYSLFNDKKVQRLFQPTYLLAFLKNTFIYLVVMLVLSAFFYEALILETKWFLFIGVLVASLYLALFKLILHILNKKIRYPLGLLTVGIVFNMVLFLIINDVLFPVWRTKSELIFFLLLTEVLFFGVKYILMRLTFNKYLR